MHNLDKAREWAEEGKDIYRPGSRIKAVIDIILSLPDQWVDVEKVQEIIEEMESLPDTTRVSSEIAIATEAWKRQLEVLVPPKLPTLADMTPEERKACQWMQARVEGFSEDGRLVIANVDDHWITLWREDGNAIGTDPGAVTPLPGPKLEWPGGVVDCETVDETPADQQPNSSETPNSSPQPKMGEWWQVEEERNGKGVGKLVEDAGDYPWLIYLNDGTHDFFKRGSVTPITRMVPETHTLPKGMRLADERTLGRVMVTTEFNEDDICEIVYWNKGLERNCPGFADESDITFLDGAQ